MKKYREEFNKKQNSIRSKFDNIHEIIKDKTKLKECYNDVIRRPIDEEKLSISKLSKIMQIEKVPDETLSKYSR